MKPTAWIWLAITGASPACGASSPAPESPDDPASLAAPADEAGAVGEAVDDRGAPGAEEQASADGAATTSIGASSMTVDGLTVTDMSCQLGGGGLLGTLTIIAGLAERKPALDACAPGGDRPRVTWTMEEGETTEVEVTGAASDEIARCVERALAGMRTSTDGRCSGVIHLGQ